jgi:5'(3')-deoxyribonucleotidase
MYFDTIACDQDGVLFDFHTAAARIHVGARLLKMDHIHTGSPLDLGFHDFHRRWPRGLSLQKWISNAGGRNTVDDEVFWKPIREDPLFWRNLAPYPWWKELLKLLSDHCENLIIVTTPDDDPGCFSGKKFLLNEYGLGNLELVTAKNKWRLAAPDTLLIDDFQKHVQAWLQVHKKRYGIPGHAILFPTPWNVNHGAAADPVGFVRKYLKTEAPVACER